MRVQMLSILSGACTEEKGTKGGRGIRSSAGKAERIACQSGMSAATTNQNPSETQ